MLLELTSKAFIAWSEDEQKQIKQTWEEQIDSGNRRYYVIFSSAVLYAFDHAGRKES